MPITSCVTLDFIFQSVNDLFCGVFFLFHRVDGLEARVSALLEGRLRAARTAEEMFRVFAKFNPLFVRPR